MNPQPVQTVAPGEPGDCDDDTNNPAMERHAAFPKLQHFDWCEENFRLVKQAITQPPAENDPQRGIKHEIIGMPSCHRGPGLSDQFEKIPPSDQDAADIGKAVPSELEKPEIKRNRGEPELVITDGRTGFGK